MLPSNDIFYDPPKLRKRLDDTGYLYFQNIIPREVVSAGLEDLASQMERCKWTLEEDRKRLIDLNGFSYGVPYPSTMYGSAVEELPPPAIAFTDTIRQAVSGTSVMAVVRQIFGGTVRPFDLQSLQLGAPGEPFGFRTPSVYVNKGTKLALVALVPLHDLPMYMGPPVVVQGSNSTDSYARLRQTYGQWEVESGDVRSGDGCYTHDPRELSPLGKEKGFDPVTGRDMIVDVNPFASTAFGAGDVLLMTVYTMFSYLTNQSSSWRLVGEAVWTMDGDDVGPDPRYMGADAVGLQNWYAHCEDPQRYPKSMTAAKREWGLLSDLSAPPAGAAEGTKKD
ncbi:phytanoyl-CoA dioxygenase [Strigomonas culicis]|uniref:Phytanoyl-CoA dioxygenase n=1 Tax=Strigomonas culicis TaxID=28005 RepID=S9TWU1_9TRYP|nr:phytanoyl-CoA dioxygenase [Strigomonas culicis]|eukprot:EPY21073.1 phytanoyl-CoA dioxygenase [Strigomonas culicis]